MCERDDGDHKVRIHTQLRKKYFRRTLLGAGDQATAETNPSNRTSYSWRVISVIPSQEGDIRLRISGVCIAEPGDTRFRLPHRSVYLRGGGGSVRLTERARGAKHLVGDDGEEETMRYL